MKKIITLCLVQLLFSNISYASNIEKVAVIDIDKIIAESEVMKDVKRQIDERRKKLQDEINKESEQFKKEEEDIEKSESKLSPEALDQKIKAFNNKINEAKRKMQTKRLNLEEAYEDTMLNINKVSQEIIAEHAVKNHVNLVLPTSQILFSDDAMNITDEIAKKLNEKIKKMALKKESEK